MLSHQDAGLFLPCSNSAPAARRQRVEATARTDGTDLLFRISSITNVKITKKLQKVAMAGANMQLKCTKIQTQVLWNRYVRHGRPG